jgi:hypothetical protein
LSGFRTATVPRDSLAQPMKVRIRRGEDVAPVQPLGASEHLPAFDHLRAWRIKLPGPPPRRAGKVSWLPPRTRSHVRCSRPRRGRVRSRLAVAPARGDPDDSDPDHDDDPPGLAAPLEELAA